MCCSCTALILGEVTRGDWCMKNSNKKLIDGRLVSLLTLPCWCRKATTPSDFPCVFVPQLIIEQGCDAQTFRHSSRENEAKKNQTKIKKVKEVKPRRAGPVSRRILNKRKATGTHIGAGQRSTRQNVIHPVSQMQLIIYSTKCIRSHQFAGV